MFSLLLCFLRDWNYLCKYVLTEDSLDRRDTVRVIASLFIYLMLLLIYDLNEIYHLLNDAYTNYRLKKTYLDK